MNRILAILSLSMTSSVIAATTCNCFDYPYRPDPPCPTLCYKKLIVGGFGDIARVKNLDPGVAVHLRILSSQSDKGLIDFDKLNSKEDLERQTLQILERKGWGAKDMK